MRNKNYILIVFWSILIFLCLCILGLLALENVSQKNVVITPTPLEVSDAQKYEMFMGACIKKSRFEYCDCVANKVIENYTTEEILVINKTQMPDSFFQIVASCL